jgi:hypothetical protein
MEGLPEISVLAFGLSINPSIAMPSHGILPPSHHWESMHLQFAQIELAILLVLHAEKLTIG